jgi:hypothetical protein
MCTGRPRSRSARTRCGGRRELLDRVRYDARADRPTFSQRYAWDRWDWRAECAESRWDWRVGRMGPPGLRRTAPARERGFAHMAGPLGPTCGSHVFSAVYGQVPPVSPIPPKHGRRQSSCHSRCAPGSMKRCTLRRGRQRGRFSPGASEPGIKFGRRPFEHPLLSQGRAPSLWLGARAEARWIELN